MTSTVAAVAISPDGTTTDVTLTSDQSGSVAADLRKAIDCTWFDCVRLVADGPASIDAWVNDEGLLTDAPNLLATMVVATLAKNPCTMLHGTIVFTSNDSAGETTSLAPASIELIKKLAALAAAS